MCEKKENVKERKRKEKEKKSRERSCLYTHCTRGMYQKSVALKTQLRPLRKGRAFAAAASTSVTASRRKVSSRRFVASLYPADFLHSAAPIKCIQAVHEVFRSPHFVREYRIGHRLGLFQCGWVGFCCKVPHVCSSCQDPRGLVHRPFPE